ncbi:unnamed protein product [Bursaphelenchus xylophilus]|uniref:(pine wood nematode) hypothetical protein n=1 Tax=Bursaphelenchus xylophilus TaxID=6326 RepID=A0A1I7SD33_BURXY|nr:unnamed protein product [Bursaphelenchus xylophilus]CAG9093016.1 unnamed protein product [Bursaphelenchus xylophilus]
MRRYSRTTIMNPENPKDVPSRTFSSDSRTSLMINFVTQVREYGSKRPKCFCKYFVGTEMHALQQASCARDIGSQIFWASLIVIFLIVSTITTKITFKDFLDDQLLTTFTINQAAKLEFPAVIICPKNPDALDIQLVYRDIKKQLKNLTEAQMKDLVGFAIADAGFLNMDKFVKNLTDEEHDLKSAMLRKWRGKRSPEKFLKTLFEKYGYTCDQLFKKCKLGAEKVPCCDLFKQHYVMLRGRCFRLTKLYQTDPDYHGRLYLNMRKLPSPIIDRSGYQPQVIAYFASPYSEVSTFPRFYLSYKAYNYISASTKAYRLRPDFSSCFPGDDRRGKSACYVRRWLYTKFINTLNCTPFYMRYRAEWADICDIGKIAKIYMDIIDITLNGTKCLPACTRLDRMYNLYTKEYNDWNIEKNVPDFRLEFGYTDLEYEAYEEVVTTTLPGFVSQIGGQLSLFLGITLLSAIQFLLSFSMFVFKKFRGVKDINLHSHLRRKRR